MWLVTKIGFFNIIQYDEDKERGLLTVKARSRVDLENLKDFVPYSSNIEESDTADYRFRIKALRREIRAGFATLINEIDYPKTKPVISADFPERSRIYFGVWDTLCEIQDAETPPYKR